MKNKISTVHFEIEYLEENCPKSVGLMVATPCFRDLNGHEHSRKFLTLKEAKEFATKTLFGVKVRFIKVTKECVA